MEKTATFQNENLGENSAKAEATKKYFEHVLPFVLEAS
jgi:hypothetical protein